MILAEDGALLARLFPLLRRVRALARSGPARAANPQEVRSRAFVAMRRLLWRLAEQRPVVLFIDDFHWADSDSLALLAELLHPTEAPAILLVATVRPPASAGEHRPVDETIARLPGDVRHVPLGALAPDEARALAARLLGADADGIEVAALAREAEGHPLFLHELVRHYTRVGSRLPGAVALDDALWARIVELEPSARRLLEVVAVAGSPIAQGIAGAAAGVLPADRSRWIDALRAANLVRTTGVRDTDEIDTYHDRVRETILGRLPSADRTATHATLADVMLASGRAAEDPLLLVRHLEAAGRNERAAEEAVRAARRAAEALAFDQSAELYRTALRLGAPSKAHELRRELAEALANAGRGSESAEVFLTIAAEADDATRFECRTRAAEQLIGSGHFHRGVEVLRAVLAEIGEDVPATPTRTLFAVATRRAWLRLRGFGWREQDASRIPPSVLKKVDVYRAVGVGLGLIDTLQGTAFHLRGLLLALATGEPRRICVALALEGVFLSAGGAHARARRVIERARALAHRTSEPYLLAWATGTSGIERYFAGDFASALEQLRAADAILGEVPGVTGELNNIRFLRLQALRYSGRYGELDRLQSELARDAVRRGDLFMQTTLARGCNTVWLVRDRPGDGREELARTAWSPPAGTYHVQNWYELRALVELDLYEGTAVGRLAELEGELRRLRQSLLPRVQIIRAEADWLVGRLALADAAAGRQPAKGARLAARLGRRLGREGIPHAAVWGLLLQAGAAAIRGATDDAIALLTRGTELAERAGIQSCAAAARRRCGELLGDEEGAALVAAADEGMASDGVRNPARMVEVITPRLCPDHGSRGLMGKNVKKDDPLAATVPTEQAATDDGVPAEVRAGGDERPPDVVGGRYRIAGMLGQGAYGHVYDATDERLQKRVAVKILGASRARNPEAIARFRGEAQLTSRLAHPAIISVTDFDVLPDGRPYLVMERAPGRTLDRILSSEGALSVAVAVAITREIAVALAAAHGAGVIHRDLKPSNVIIDGDLASPSLKILDFGIAKLAETDHDPYLTRSGHLLGTPVYMAPEQVHDKMGPVDARADVYALGIMFYEMLTGAPPFKARSVADMMMAHVLRAPAPPSRRRQGIPPAVEGIVLRMLAKKPSRRYGSAHELVAALDRWARSGGSSRDWRSTRLVALGATLVVVSAGAGLWIGRGETGSRPEPTEIRSAAVEPAPREAPPAEAAVTATDAAPPDDDPAPAAEAAPPEPPPEPPRARPVRRRPPSDPRGLPDAPKPLRPPR